MALTIRFAFFFLHSAWHYNYHIGLSFCSYSVTRERYENEKRHTHNNNNHQQQQNIMCVIKVTAEQVTRLSQWMSMAAAH